MKKITASVVLKYQKEAKKITMTTGEFKRLSRELCDIYGLTDREAIDILNNNNVLEILKKYEEVIELKKYVLSNGEIIDVSTINLKIDKYFQIINTKEAYCDEKGDYYLLDGKLFRDNGIYPMPIEIEQTSDNILDLAREEDLVRCCDIYELFEVDGALVFYSDEVANYLMEKQKNITMLYKKVGNNYIGYEVE